MDLISGRKEKTVPPIIDEERCSRCGKCAEVCSEDVFFGSKKKEIPVISYGEECWHCNACVLDCPVEGAIRLRIPLPNTVAFK
jgi:adenylylsulfate reductase subunit B